MRASGHFRRGPQVSKKTISFSHPYNSTTEAYNQESWIYQEIEIPATGSYAVTAMMGASGELSGSKFGLRGAEDKIDIQTVNIVEASNYQRLETAPIDLEAGDCVEIFAQMSTTGNWINGYSFSLSLIDPNEEPEPEPTPEHEPDYGKNLLHNAGFEETGGWVFDGVSGYMTNNPHTGKRGFYLDNHGTDGVYQEVTAPCAGWYTGSAWIAVGGSNSTFGVKNITDSTEAVLTLSSGYKQYEAPAIYADAGDTLRIQCYGGTGWTNGDDFTLAFDYNSFARNLLGGVSLTPGKHTVHLPWDGDYAFRATVSGGEVTLGETTTEAGACTLTEQMAGELNITVPQGCAVTEVSLAYMVSGTENTAPTASEVQISDGTLGGKAMAGDALTGGYAFTDSDKGANGLDRYSTFRWLSADTADGAYAAIEGATGKGFTLTGEQEGKYVKFEVTPVDGGKLAGAPVSSEAYGPVLANLVDNPSLEIAEGKNPPTGWTSRDGGTMPKGSAARTGSRFVRVPAVSENGEVYYTATLPETANYLAGAYVKTTSAVGSLGVRLAGSGEPLVEMTLPDTDGKYQYAALPTFAAEAGTAVQLFIRGAKDCSLFDADDFQLVLKNAEDLPTFVALRAFLVEGQTSCRFDVEAHTITITVPYGTNVTALEVTSAVSSNAAIAPASGTAMDFTQPQSFTITNGSASVTWTVSVAVEEKRLMLTSDNETLEEGFNWAVGKTNQFVMTGIESGPINVPQSGGQTADYMPSYWAGYYDRTAFYGRDFAHQTVGAQIVGLWDENWNMFKTFAGFANEERKWYTGWAFNFDGSIYTMDYQNNNSFVREVPAQFELVEKAYKQYLWSGDEAYITDETLWNFYTKVMTDYITLHDPNKNGVAEGTGKGIFAGACSYNEKEHGIIEAGDAIASQYQATLAYAAMLREKGRIESNETYTQASEVWFQKAAELKTYFNEEWSVKEGADPSDPGDNYVRATDGKTTQYTGFGHENSWFMPMKLITEPGARNDAYLDYIEQNMGEYIGQNPGIHTNIEAWTYLPDTYFPYNRNDTAWKYLKHVIESRDDPHERPIQGTNGDYPEVSFMVISQTIEGMMGMEADAANHKVVTAPRLPREVPNLSVKYIHMGEHLLDITHDSLTESKLYNESESPLSWEARFYGNFAKILANGKVVEAQHKDVNGVLVSYAVIPVPANGSAIAEAYVEPSYNPPSNTTTTTEKNEDGSTTKTVTDKKTGNVTATTTYPDGTKIVAVTPKDGKTSLEVIVPKDKESVTVTIPTTEKPAPGEVVVIIREDGTREIIKTSVSTEDGLRVTLTGNAKLEIVDNSKGFVDVAGSHWAADAVQFVTSRELFTGTGKDSFSPMADMSRAMLVTVLARLDGQDTSKGESWDAVGAAWAQENGISDGENLDSAISREQLAVMLYRYAKAEKTEADLTDFSDAGGVSAWAAEAVAWAVKSGILQGSGGKLAPNATAIRAEVAAMLQRFITTAK